MNSMKLQSTISSDDLNLSKQYHFILFSPRMRQRNFRFEQFLNLTSRAYYLSLNSQVASLDAFLDKLAEALREQGLPGNKLANALAKGTGQTEQLVQALLSDLEHAGEGCQLVLDNLELVKLDDQVLR